MWKRCGSYTNHKLEGAAGGHTKCVFDANNENFTTELRDIQLSNAQNYSLHVKHQGLEYTVWFAQSASL